MAKQVIRVRSDMRQFEKSMKLAPEKIRKAQAMALNKTMPKVKTAALREAAAKTGIKSSILRSRFRFSGRLKATPNRLEVVLILDLRSLPAHKIGPPPRQTRAGVKVGKQLFRGAFLAPGMYSGAVMVFERRGNKKRMDKGNYPGQWRQPIYRVDVPFQKEALSAAKGALNRVGLSEYPRELQRAINLQMKRSQK